MQIDLSVPRNGDYFAEWQLIDNAGEPIDINGHVFEMAAREMAGAGLILADATITIVEPQNGMFTVRWKGSDFDAVGEPTVPVAVAYDLKHTYPDGVTIVPVRGYLILQPEATP